MEENLKQLLLKDLCARLPYGVICRYDTVVPLLGEVLNNGELQEIRNRGKYFIVNGATCLYDDIKPYLRPMSSMTEAERSELSEEVAKAESGISDEIANGFITDIAMSSWTVVSYCLKKHLDINGLISKGLALEAPEGIYNIN